MQTPETETNEPSCVKPTLVIVSGYFGPIHVGHLDLIEGGAEIGDELLVIINNNAQQIAKKGTLIMEAADRERIVAALKKVDHTMIAIDEDRTVCASIAEAAKRFPNHKIIFGNGGDRTTNAVVPESAICNELGIEMRFDIGGTEKADSSTRIIEAMQTATNQTPTSKP